MYLGRIVAVGKTIQGDNIAAHRVPYVNILAESSKGTHPEIALLQMLQDQGYEQDDEFISVRYKTHSGN
jgi:hypothetical protein